MLKDLPDAPGNWLLAAFPDDARDAMLARAMRVPLRLGDVIAKPGVPIEHGFFPTSGMLSLAAKIADGNVGEMGSCGWEGFFSPGFILGAATTSGECTVQVEGEAWAVPRQVFDELAAANARVRTLMQRYTNAWMNGMGLHAACNAVHTVDERCARWILASHDRVPGDTILLTHEFLSVMLGVRRASVSIAAGILREAGLIDYTRGRVRVVDRGRLELASCPCYRALRHTYDEIGIDRLVDHAPASPAV